ncbi:hypothetical protein XENOCAPTIV_029317 [Xenoophorus captivus]|uniref:Uncharacterized protein n=1 Tax=Xenoophorus captivus TaxID=1517983 RepID=A0ABV0RVL4_9TELE
MGPWATRNRKKLKDIQKNVHGQLNGKKLLIPNGVIPFCWGGTFQRENTRMELTITGQTLGEAYTNHAPSYESPLLSRPYCAEGITSREACMYGGMEAQSGSGAADKDDRTSSPSVNCNMWATMQPYSRYSMEGVPYQPFTPHFPNSAPVHPVLPQPASSMLSRPQADLGVYNSTMVQRSLPVIPQSSSSSSGSPVLNGSRDTISHSPLYHKKPGSPLQPLKEYSACSTQGMIPIRDSSYQYQVGLSSAGSHWTDS